jgi:uncharacterized protein YbjT (DUF2867 family)
MERTILVIGATGAMGRPVVQHLLAASGSSFRVRVFTRDPSSPQAQQLLSQEGGRVEAAKGNIDDPESLAAALAGVFGVFCNTDFSSARSVEGEYEQGLRVLVAARAAGVEHFVWSSLDDCVGLSRGRLPVPHYDAKAAVEHYINRHRSDEFLRKDADGFFSRHVSVLVTGPYYENLMTMFRPRPGKLRDGREGMIFALPGGGKPYPMVALDDIGWFAAHMFEHPERFVGRTLPIMSQSLTLDELAAVFSEVTGIPAEHRDIPVEEMWNPALPIAHDLWNMHSFVQEIGWRRDYEELRRIHPGLLSFEAWLRRTGWRGEAREVQKAFAQGRAPGGRA